MAESQTIWDTQDAIVSRSKDKELNTRPPSGVTISGVIHTTKIITPAFKNETKQFKDDEPARLSRAVPLGCCLYPWPNPGSPLYPPSDLPATVIEGGVKIYNHVAGTYRYESTFDDLVIEPGTGANSGIWIQYPASSPHLIAHGTGCLIAAVFGVIEDQFFDNYNLQLDAENVTLTRDSQNICVWNGTAAGGAAVLEYNSLNYEFELTTLGGAVKNDPQSSPVGTYTPGGGSPYTTIVVS